VLTVPLYQGGQLAANVALAWVRRDVQELANEQQRLLALDEGVSTACATLTYLMGDAPTEGTPVIVLADSLAMPDSSSVFVGIARRDWTQRPERLRRVVHFQASYVLRERGQSHRCPSRIDSSRVGERLQHDAAVQ
jgi:outer membrane protein TolC